MLSSNVNIGTKIPSHTDIFISDLSTDIKILKELKAKNKTLVISIHGFIDSSHNLPAQQINDALKLADKIHFVSQVQQDSYRLDPENFFIIPNSTAVVHKNRFTQNIGSVGNLNDARKGADKTVMIGALSKAKEIHLWYRHDNQCADKRVICHSRENNKKIIYESFDVLVFMSESETFGLVIIEALSAGIPCILPSINVFQQFRDCAGVKLVDPDNINAIAREVNIFLCNKDKLRKEIIRYFHTNFSDKHIKKLWESAIFTIYSNKN